MTSNYEPKLTPQFGWAMKELGVSLDEFRETMSHIKITSPADPGLAATDLGAMLLAREIKKEKNRVKGIAFKRKKEHFYVPLIWFLAVYGGLEAIHNFIKLIS